MVNARESAGQSAPGELESIRSLLNSWLIPNESRVPSDEFGTLAAVQGWSRRQAALVRQLRNDLRHAVESRDTACINEWIGRLSIRPEVQDRDLVYQHDGSVAGHLLAVVVAAVGAGTWARLKACPDCHWVFYDSTRNASKRWCLMYAGGPDGRACGTIAKVRRYRERWGTATDYTRPAGS